MTIKERALIAIKQNYAKFGLKAEELDKLATHIAGGLKDETTDDELNTAVEGAKFYAEMMQSVGNRKATEVQNKYKDYIPKPAEPTPPATPPATPPSGNLTIEQVQEMIAKANADREKAIEEAVQKATAPFVAQQEKERLSALLNNHEKLKSIPQQFRGLYTLDKEENLDTLVSKIEADYTALKQAQVSSGQFVEAPAPTSPESEADDFIKRMEDFGTRNAVTEPAQK